MTIEVLFYLYAIFFRLSIIVSGIICIIIGYRLFCKGLYTKPTGQDKTQLSAKIGDAELSLKNAGPGTIFAFFGLVIIFTMIVQGNPKLTITNQVPTRQSDQAHSHIKTKKGRVSKSSDSTQIATSYQIETRSGSPEDAITFFNDKIATAQTYQKNNQYSEAITEYISALKTTSNHLNELAFLLSIEGPQKYDDAIHIISTAIFLKPTDTNILDTRATIYEKIGDNQKAKQDRDKIHDIQSK